MTRVAMAPLAALCIATATVTAPAAALAGPSCVDRNGDMARCGTPSAMPVGWSPPAAVERARLAARSAEMDPAKLLGLVFFVGGLFALFALLPDFQGRWDREQGDEEPRR